MNYEELKDWCDEARRSVGREMDRLQEQQLTMGNHLQVLEAAGDLLGEMERQKDELEQKQQEIDLVEECDGQLSAFEFKWKPGRNARMPMPFTEAYPNATFQTVTPDNYQTFVSEE
jgi:hypothetical protein